MSAPAPKADLPRCLCEELSKHILEIESGLTYGDADAPVELTAEQWDALLTAAKAVTP